MSWTAPGVERVGEPNAADERTMLEGWSDWHRATLFWKCADLTPEQLVQRSIPPSTLSLLGLIRHLTDAERAWFRREFGGQDFVEAYFRDDQPDAAFDEATAGVAEADYARLVEEAELCRLAVANAS